MWEPSDYDSWVVARSLTEGPFPENDVRMPRIPNRDRKGAGRHKSIGTIRDTRTRCCRTGLRFPQTTLRYHWVRPERPNQGS